MYATRSYAFSVWNLSLCMHAWAKSNENPHTRYTHEVSRNKYVNLASIFHCFIILIKNGTTFSSIHQSISFLYNVFIKREFPIKIVLLISNWDKSARHKALSVTLRRYQNRSCFELEWKKNRPFPHANTQYTHTNVVNVSKTIVNLNTRKNVILIP